MEMPADIRDAFDLAPDLIHLNHGSYGAVPRNVRTEQDRLRLEIERDPTGFFQDRLPDEFRRIAGSVAQRFGGEAKDWVFVENATQAVNGILASFPLEPDGELLTTSHAYGAVRRAMDVWASRRGAVVAEAKVPFHLDSEEQVVAAVTNAFSARTRMLVIDHITSATAVIFPVARIAAAAKAAGIAVLVDGAHVPGHLPLDVTALGVDWYTGNAHKWLFAPRGCGLLWTAPERQLSTKPAVISWGRGDGYAAEFDWIGTRDVTSWLAFEAAASFHGLLGGEALSDRNRAGCRDAVDIIGRQNGFRLAAGSPDLRGAMAAFDIGPATGEEAARKLRTWLRNEHRIVVPVGTLGDRMWCRISHQAYNKPEHYQRLRDALWKRPSN